MRRRQSEVEEHRLGETEYLLQYKRIRRMYLRLKMPDAKIFVTAPYYTSLPEVEQFIAGNMDWIERQRKRQEQMVPKPVRHFESGETLYVWGKAYELLLLTDPDMVRQMCGEEAAGALLKHNMAAVKIENSKLMLSCPAGFDEAKRERCLDAWMKRQMGAFLPAIF